jgi:hypothetical protein
MVLVSVSFHLSFIHFSCKFALEAPSIRPACLFLAEEKYLSPFDPAFALFLA